MAIGILLGGGVLALLLNGKPRLSGTVAVATTCVAAVLGMIPSLTVLLTGKTLSYVFAWPLPYTLFSAVIDPLAAFFLFIIFSFSFLAAIYGQQYLQPWEGKKPLGLSWFFFNTLIASMALVVAAQNVILFLISWETMALASFFLVVFEDEDEKVRRAGTIYLVATHLGTAFLIVFFLLLFPVSAGLDFSTQAVLTPGMASLLFILAVVGFGTKAGLVPFHVWLPEAHPCAPSHVSALMSAVMIKMGIYGLLRALTFLGAPPAWWGILLIGLGLGSGVYGIIFALAQSDLKKFLAYSSVENIGIVCAGIGLGLLGLSYGISFLMVLGFAGALLHILNHAVFKGLLFLGSGVIVHESGTRDVDLLGGLLKRMPRTGVCFLVGAMAIAGLPPLNGFVSEFILYWASFQGIVSGSSGMVAFLSMIFSLAVIGGLAVVGFVKIFTTVFLGEPRSALGRESRDPGWCMQLPMVILSVMCLILAGLVPFYLVRLLTPIIAQIIKAPTSLIVASLWDVENILNKVILASLLGGSIFGIVYLLRRQLLAKRKIESGLTWDCGYAQPSGRMQYTGTSFVEPFLSFFNSFLRPRIKKALPSKIFPSEASWFLAAPDLFSRGLYRRASDFIYAKISQWRWIQHGRAHFYILYILLTLLILIVWKMR